MADEGNTHIIEPGDVAKSSDLVTIEWDGKSIEVPASSADTIRESLRTMESGLKTKHEQAMEDVKAYRAKVAKWREEDVKFYQTAPQEVWESYVPLVDNEGQGGYRGDPSLLTSKPNTDDSYDIPDVLSTKKTNAMTPNPMQSELTKLQKEQSELRTALERRNAQDTLSTMDRILPKYTLADPDVVRVKIMQHYDQTGQHATKDLIESYAKDSHNKTKERVSKAGDFKEKPRYDGTPPPGGLPREKVKGVPGSIFSNKQADKDAANAYLASLLTD